MLGKRILACITALSLCFMLNGCADKEDANKEALDAIRNTAMQQSVLTQGKETVKKMCSVFDINGDAAYLRLKTALNYSDAVALQWFPEQHWQGSVLFATDTETNINWVAYDNCSGALQTFILYTTTREVLYPLNYTERIIKAVYNAEDDMLMNFEVLYEQDN